MAGRRVRRGISVDVQRSAIKIPPQTAYGMTISSTADSGGGLPDVGAFAHEKVYTVYLDMRETPPSTLPRGRCSMPSSFRLPKERPVRQKP